MLVNTLLPFLLAACSPSDSEGDTALLNGWVELEASSTVMPGMWYAESPVEGPAPVELWVTPDGARWAESEFPILWIDQEDRPLVDLMADANEEARAVYYVWVD